MANLSLEKHGFIKLKHSLQSVGFYELENSPNITGEPDFTRLNIYLCKDGNFVNIWHGFLESLFAETALEKKGVEVPEEIDLNDTYTTKLFRGYIENDSDLEVILRAIHINDFKPHILTGDQKNRLCCQSID